MRPDHPIPDSYWAVPGQLLAGEYPGHPSDTQARAKLERLLDAGVTLMIDLTEPGEYGLRPYAPLLAEVAAARGRHVEHRRFPIPDLDTPPPAAMSELLATLDAALAAGHCVYLHCYGGVGRTGTVVGCYLVAHGLTGDAAIATIARLRADTPDGRRTSPETAAQQAMVRAWRQTPSERATGERDRFLGALLGLAVGDAVGTTLEFRSPGSFTPITDMVGGGPFGLAAGQWTDDTSMALCLATSLVERPEFDPRDQMERYVQWWQAGYLSSTGTCFDIGGTTQQALARFVRTGEPFAGTTDPHSAGNGSIMRLAPVALRFAYDPATAIAQAAASSRTTHGAPTAVDGCRYLAALIVGALRGEPKERLLAPRYTPVPGAWDAQPLHPEIGTVAAGSFTQKQPPAIRGSGYVVASLEAALWAFANSETFQQGCLMAANLGDDADTTAAVYGQLAGAYYGADGIPAAWRARLAQRTLIEQLATDLHRLATRPPTG